MTGISELRPNSRTTNFALVTFGLLMVEFCRIGNLESDHYVIGFSAVAFSQAIVFVASLWAVITQPSDRWTLPIIVLVAILCRVVLLLHAPFLSSDVYRYIWDGKVQAAGINPYRFVAADPQLRFLVDDKIFPHMNRRDYAHTIYPPGAQMIFLLITRFSSSVVWMKTVMVGFEAVTCWALFSLLRDLKIPREHLLLYLWNPLALWEISSSGHMDAIAIAFITLALLYRLRGRPTLTAVAIGMATLSKLYPIILLPALFRRKDWKMPIYVMGIIGAGYAFYSSVGSRVLGFLPDYAREEGINSGSRYFLLAFARNVTHTSISTGAYLAVCAAGFAALSWWALKKSEERNAFLITAFVFVCALTLLFSPHYPWYFLWLVPFTVLIPYVPIVFYVTASFFLYTTSLAAPGPRMYFMNEWLYGSLLTLIVIDWGKRRYGSGARVSLREIETTN